MQTLFVVEAITEEAWNGGIFSKEVVNLDTATVYPRVGSNFLGYRKIPNEYLAALQPESASFLSALVARNGRATRKLDHHLWENSRLGSILEAIIRHFKG